MATKKAKREAAAAQREAFLAELKADGLKAQEYDRARREEKARRNALKEEERIKREAVSKSEIMIDDLFKDAIHRIAATVFVANRSKSDA